MKAEEKKTITDKLKSINATKVCARCGNKNFEILDGYFVNTIQDDLNSFRLGGAGIPMVVIICDKCGHVNMHAAGALGLFTKKGEE